ncbi:MAG TPA: biotin synthase BioB, partial [Anaeromyxobacteraceae bacterium]|nr:biotin synthase BioB [Anaeromyxobacteraceae bacterium]
MCETTARPPPPGIEPISGDEARRLIRLTGGPGFEALLDRAEAARRAVHGDEVSLCGITNAKSGLCPEDCGFCSQSAHFKGAEAPVYPLVTPREMVEQAKLAEAAGAREFSIVTSGTRVAKES